MTNSAADPAETSAALTLPRVLLLGWEYAPRLTGGLGTASVRLAHALAERTELSVIVPRLPDAPDADDPDAEPPLSVLAAATNGPDELRHFPESADWTAERPRRPSLSPVSRVFADGDGAPAPGHETAPRGWPVRLTALSALSPADVRATTAPPRPPGYEVFARQVHRVTLGVLPYAEPSALSKVVAPLGPPVGATEEPAKLREHSAALPKGVAKPAEQPADLPQESAEATETSVTSPEVAAEVPEASVTQAEVVEESAEQPEASAKLYADPLAESLAPFRRPAINPLTLPSSNTEVVQFARLAARVASGDDIDVVYAHDWPTFLAGVEIKLAKKVPLVLHVHSTSYDRHGALQGWVFELERAAFRAADRVVAVSHYGAGVLRAHYGLTDERIRVVHHGLSADALGPQWEARPVSATPTVLFIGRLTDQKNPLGFVEVAQLVAAEVPGVRFRVAGDGPRRAAMQAAADAARLDAFELLGFLDDEAVTAALAAADVVCLPARSEPFGLAALEAAAAGVPLVLSATTGAAEVLPGARTAPYDDPAALAAHVIELLRDEPARRRAVRENAAAARRLTWERAADEVLAVLEEVVVK